MIKWIYGPMATHWAIDDQLLQEAFEISGLNTQKGTANLALKESVARHKPRDILKLFGKMDPDSNYDNKTGRSR